MGTSHNRNMEGNAAAVTVKLLQLLQVPFTGSFAADFKLRPEYPSLIGISNALHELNVDNIVVSITVDQIQEISFPVIAQLKRQKDDFVIMLGLDDGTVRYLDGKLKEVRVSIAGFVKIWTGILLVAEATDRSGEPGYTENRKAEILSRVRLVILPILLVGILSSLLLLNSAFVLPIVVNSLGAGLCVALLMQTLGQNNMLSDAVCRPVFKIDCSQVVNSAVDKIYSDISLAEIGLLFFAGGLFANILLMTGNFTVFNFYLLTLCVLSVPFTIFSIYYQWRIVKMWCPLCLGVVGLLWSATVYYSVNYSPFHFDASELIAVAAGYSLSLAIWLVVRPSVIKAQSVPSLRKALYKFSKNQEVFDALLHKTELISGGITKAVVLGKPDARHSITLATSPGCNPCINVHHQVESLLHQFEEDLNVVVRFVVNPNDDRAVPNIVAKNLISLSLNGDCHKVEEAMKAWYNPERPHLDDWLSLLPSELHPKTEEYFAGHYEWCNENNVMAAPTIFFDGRQIPGEYSFKDLESILRVKLNDDE